MSKGKALTTRAKPKAKSNAALAPAFTKPTSPQSTAVPPTRAHSSAYHYPLILDDSTASKELLGWFEGIEEARNMPWRKRWLDPAQCEVLQQTRVSTVIPYFNNWISKWPTVDSLAQASHDDVLSVWKGLGYYSRATRLHEGAKAVVSMKPSQSCKIPSGVVDLQKIPGIGRYTAGAVSSIAFGEAEPVLDGNVARVLSRQLGLYVDAKDKKSTDAFWEVADQLIKTVAGHPEKGRSEVPGQWNQALMELGSTICTPRPKCEECPIRRTCRVYAEGETLSIKKAPSTEVPDIEDACTLCQQLDTEDLTTAPEEHDEDEDDVPVKPAKRRKTEQKQSNTLSNYFTLHAPKQKPATSTPTTSTSTPPPSTKRKALTATPAQTKAIATYCSLFPKKMPKKAVPEEDAVVCVIEAAEEGGPSKWFIEQRPAKGLLASLWQFPQQTLPDTDTVHTAATRKAAAQAYVESLDLGVDGRILVHLQELGSLVHVFTHLKLTMHVVHLKFEIAGKLLEETPGRKWVETEKMEGETLSTGMRRCWDLVKKKTTKAFK
ncbi:hypothetical protein SLS60_002851 [Paraconiothyrium brasiliense]|uniref:Adenine DNA glycosylase n=1 Tax=Paraconiothyrium brasiliense TaxID=300254 RepID=A0ABR3RU96_9PLEO